nr:uncharacterized protein LOC110125789 isoform X2 [Odocoileus virginianus texanus]
MQHELRPLQSRCLRGLHRRTLRLARSARQNWKELLPSLMGENEALYWPLSEKLKISLFPASLPNPMTLISSIFHDGRECSLKISTGPSHLWPPCRASPTLPYLKPIKIYKLKASGKEHNLGNCLLGNLTTARVPWKSALNTIVVHPISSQLYRRACGQGLAGKRPGCPSS